MKPSGLLLAASVVGAVAIGGATTGSTHATWRDSASLAPATVGSGYLSVAVHAPSAAPPALEANASTMVRIPVDTAGAGENLLTLTSIQADKPAAPVSLAVAVVATDASCDTANPVPWEGGTLPLTSEPVAPGGPVAVCLKITRADGAVPGGSVSLTLRALAQQYRGSTPTGWNDSAQVTVSVPTPTAEPVEPDVSAPENFRCATSSADKSLTVLWDALDGAVRYEVRKQVDSSQLPVGGATVTTLDIDQNVVTNRGADEFYVVAVRADGSTSGPSSSLVISRQGHLVTCGPKP